ncbi:YchE family NAAT transporter [Klebsiella pneumoniae]|nr:YchE family NAAT transporter [Klebsiella pneumoniae]
MTQSLFDFSAYFKFFIGLFALVNPVGIIPVFISMTSYQPAAVRNKTNLTANLSVAIILLTSLFLGDGILQIFGISIDSFRIAGGILVVTIAMSMISGKLGEDKQNKQEKSETAVRESIGVVPRATINGRAGQSVQLSSGDPVPLLGASGRVLTGDSGICPLLLGIFRMAPWLVRLLGQTGINVITRIMGLLLMALGIEFIVTGIKALFPGLLS